jgi:hypothetical protein
MIHIEETIKQLGYCPDNLGPKSDRYIIVECDYCKSIYRTIKKNVVNSRKNCIKDACKKCINHKRKDCILNKYGIENISQLAKTKESIKSHKNNNIEDLTGKDFYNWHVLKQDTKIKSRILYLCECKCGKTQRISGYNLTNIRSKSCRSCANRRYVGKISGALFNKIKYGAMHRNILFNITHEYIWDLYTKQSGLCALTGRKIDFANSSYRQSCGDTTASLDRIDSLQGYIESNVQWVHKNINIIKKNLDQEEFIKLCCEVANYIGNKNESIHTI